MMDTSPNALLINPFTAPKITAAANTRNNAISKIYGKLTPLSTQYILP
jgi:hypothetical protein